MELNNTKCKDKRISRKNMPAQTNYNALLVRPKLVYASNVSPPDIIKHKLLIENVQRRATRFILNYP